jgi:hypothetical protein
MKPFEIFKPGRHTSTQGVALTFGEADLAAIAAGYDPATHEAPIVVGHPKQDAPAYGWIASLAVKDGRLVATPDQVNPAFAELVETGSFKKRSAALYHPDSPGNPTPGQYYLRHVGFLGAQPPALKGLKPVEFAEGDAVVEIEFGEFSRPWVFDGLARLFRGLRDYLIETTDAETADRLIPGYEIDQLVRVASEISSDAQPAFADPEPKEPVMTTKTADEQLAAIAAREAAIAERETAIAAREASFSEAARVARKMDDDIFVAAVVKDGRLPIGLQASALALFSELGEGELTFSEGDQEVKTSPRAAFRDLLSKLPKPVSTGELAAGDGPDFSDPAHVQEAIETEIRKAGEKGEKLSPAAAAMRLKAR